jgi:hypothetical protein
VAQLKAHAKSVRRFELVAAGGLVDNIVLASEPDVGIAPIPETQRNAVHSYSLSCRPNGSFTALSILEGHYLGVCSLEPSKEPLKYQIDLRFADPTPVRSRRLPWFWLLAAASFGAFAYGALRAALSAGNTLQSSGMIGGLVATAISIVALYVTVRRTTESLQLRSVHGHAALVSVTGDLGSARRYNEVFTVLSRNVRAARLARPQERPQFLRDEMREHFRLHQLGVLSEKQYEASKARILAAHSR